jgi:5-methylcytosine-specific restriction endonuclease McrA
MICVGCSGVGFSESDIVASDELGDYCSVECQERRHKRVKVKKKTLKVCDVCGTEFFTARDHQRLCSKACGVEANRIRSQENWLRVKATQPETKVWICAWCNGEMVVPFSYTGSRKYHEDCALKAKRQRNRLKTVKRQSGRVQGLRVDVEFIADRDKYVCHICSDTVDMSLARNSRYGATLDHVIPLSKGGDDSLDNLKLAHWICNVRKSDKLGELNG